MRRGRISVDEARLRPHLRAQLERQQADVFAAEYERASTAEIETTSPAWKTPTGDDRERLRGLPCIARGVTGAQPGSNPVGALLAKERRRR